MSNVVVEQRSIDVVPDAERHGTPISQYTLWFVANMQVTAVGADISWIVGFVVTAAVYPPARRTANPPDRMISSEGPRPTVAAESESRESVLRYAGRSGAFALCATGSG